MSSGYDHIDIDHCKKLGIRVANISSSMSESVALSKRLYFGFDGKVYYSNHKGRKEDDETVGAKYVQSIDE